MPKKSVRKPKPIKIQFTFLVQDDWSVLVSYEGTSEKTREVGRLVLEAIAHEYDFQLTAIA